MPSFDVGELKSRALAAKTSASERASNFRDKHSSVSSEKLDLEARRRLAEERKAQGPPPALAPKPKKAPPPPPTHIGRPSIDASSPRPSVESTTSVRSSLFSKPAPVVPRSSKAPPPPVIKYNSRPDAVSREPADAIQPPLVDVEPSSSGSPPLPPSRRSARPAANETESSITPNNIDWKNLSPEDKEVFFGWLDEFFSAQLKVDLSSHKRTGASARPALSDRKSTTQAAPTTKAHFGSRVDELRAQTRPTFPHHAESAPPLPGNRPAIVASSKPAYKAPTKEECIRCRDYSSPDQYAAQFPREQVRSLAELGVQLTEPYDALVDKARAIFTWMHHNIAYNAQAFLSGNVKPSTPENTLRTGLAVCEGYAGLYARLALAAGLECTTISGHGKGFGYKAPLPGSPLPAYSGNHAWNAVKLDNGEWKLIDSTWGAGALMPDGTYNKRFEAAMFTMPNELFGHRHFPEPHEPWKQYVARPITWETYMSLPEPPRAMGDLARLGYAADLLMPDTLVIPPGRHTFYLKKSCEHVIEDESEEYVPIMMSQREERTPLEFDPHRGGWSLDVDVVRGECVRLGFIRTLNGKDARGAGRHALVGFYGRMDFGILAEWNVE